MRENQDFVVPVNILTLFARAPFSWAARHTTVCLDIRVPDEMMASFYMYSHKSLLKAKVCMCHVNKECIEVRSRCVY